MSVTPASAGIAGPWQLRRRPRTLSLLSPVPRFLLIQSSLLRRCSRRLSGDPPGTRPPALLRRGFPSRRPGPRCAGTDVRVNCTVMLAFVFRPHEEKTQEPGSANWVFLESSPVPGTRQACRCSLGKNVGDVCNPTLVPAIILKGQEALALAGSHQGVMAPPLKGGFISSLFLGEVPATEACSRTDTNVCWGRQCCPQVLKRQASL